MKIEAVTYKAQQSDRYSDNNPPTPFRATCRCPVTGEHLTAAGSTPSAALHALGRNVSRILQQLTGNTAENAEIDVL